MVPLKTMAMLLSVWITAMLTCKEVPCVENLQIAYCANYRNIVGYRCQQSELFVILTETRGILGCGKGKSFYERPFILNRQ